MRALVEDSGLRLWLKTLLEGAVLWRCFMALFKSLAGCYRMANHLVDEGAKGFGAAALKRGYTGVVNDRLERRPLDASTLRQPLKSETTALGAGQAKL